MPKTLRNKYYENLTFEKLMEAHKKARRGKGLRDEIIKFNLKQEEYIYYLLEVLKNKTYKHGGYQVFYVTEPKLRKIEKSRYIDRAVHRWLVDNFLEPYFVPSFINTSYACIKGRGMHKACLDVQKAMRSCKNKWGTYYILKMDVSKYFENIDKRILISILEKKILDKNVMWLIKEILYSQEKEVGLEIGNYTSQLFANIYLNEVDQYVKKELGVKYYFRYMDDSVLMVSSKEEAKYYLEKIKNFLFLKLGLCLNKKTQIFKSKQGINFCGYKINENRLKLRDKGKRKLKKKVKKLKSLIKEGKISSVEAKRFLSGHMGYIKIADTWSLENKLFFREDNIV